MFLSSGWQFRLFNFPVRVHFSFFLTAVFLGLGIQNIFLLIIWVAIVFISILIHELGHAIVSGYYGRSPYIELRWSGGVTISSRYSLLSYPKEILISLSGALSGFIMGGLIILINKILGPMSNPYLNFVINNIIWVNIGWGIFNLIPILPLDGGSIMRNLYYWLKSPYDARTPHLISIIFGILSIICALILLRGGGLYIALLFGLLTFKNYQAYRSGIWSDSLV